VTPRPRSLLLSAVALLAALVAAAAALASPPDREPLFFDDFVAEDVCSFPVLIEVTANKEFVTFFEDGRILITGKLFARVTNLDTGTSLDLNISGPATITDTEVSRGRGLFILFPQDAGGPGLVLTSGRVVVMRAEDGFIANMKVQGRTVDLCAALSG
jgi:hypothetical protein